MSPGTASVPDGKYSIRQIFALSYDEYKSSACLSPEQLTAASCITKCRTGELGHNYYQCSECGALKIVPRSCGNRNCPSCQAVDKAVWLEERKGELIDAPYFHIVGTLPHELNPIIAANKKVLYELLHRSMGTSLSDLSKDPKYLGASPGIMQILHTWDQQLQYHVHVHCVVSGGGLTKDGKLVTLDKDASFFIPVKVVSVLYRGRFMAGLKELYEGKKLAIPDTARKLAFRRNWQTFVDSLYSKDWNVYIKQTFNGNGNAIEYLSRYANRIAISNSRIISYTKDSVTFSYRDRKDGGKKKEYTLSSSEFIRRFLQHVLPKGFQKIRYYGFLNNSRRKKNMEIIFSLQGGRKYEPRFDRSSPIDRVISAAWGTDGLKCPECGKMCMEFLMSGKELERLSALPDMRPVSSLRRPARARSA